MNGHNLHRLVRPPTTLTDREQSKLLVTTGDHVRGWRDHMIYTLDLGTALREEEILALDVGDVAYPDLRVRSIVQLRVFKMSNPDPKMQTVRFSRTVRAKMERYLARRREQGDELGPAAPLFASRERPRLSARQLRTAFAKWQAVAGFDRTVNFHCMRHTSISNFYRRTKDLLLTARFARHRDLESTRRYTHFTDQDFEQAVELLPC
jgi:integrase/recombinase XerC